VKGRHVAFMSHSRDLCDDLCRSFVALLSRKLCLSSDRMRYVFPPLQPRIRSDESAGVNRYRRWALGRGKRVDGALLGWRSTVDPRANDASAAKRPWGLIPVVLAVIPAVALIISATYWFGFFAFYGIGLLSLFTIQDLLASAAAFLPISVVLYLLPSLFGFVTGLVRRKNSPPTKRSHERFIWIFWLASVVSLAIVMFFWKEYAAIPLYS